MNDRASGRARAEAGGYFNMLNHALDCLYGEHGPVDPVEARRWLRRILDAGSGSEIVKVSLGRMLVGGEGGPRNLLGGLSLLRAYGGSHPEAAVYASRAARMLASEQAALVVAGTDRGRLEADLADATAEGSEEADWLQRELDQLDEAEQLLDTFPEGLPDPWPSPGQVPADPAAFLDLLQQRSEARDPSAEEVSAPRLTRHWVTRILRLASLRMGQERECTVPPSEAPAVGALQRWFDQRDAEAKGGWLPTPLEVPALAGTTVQRLNRLRAWSVLLEPLQPVYPMALVIRQDGLLDEPDAYALATEPTPSRAAAVIDRLEAGHQERVPVLVEALSRLDDEVVRTLLPRVVPFVTHAQPMVVELALRVGAPELLDGVVAGPMAVRSRGRTVEVLVRGGHQDRARQVAELPLDRTHAPLLEREVEGALMAAALQGTRADARFPRYVMASSAHGLKGLRRLALLAVRGHSDPLWALTMLAERLLDQGDDDPFHRIGSWWVAARIDVLASAVVELATGVPMDSPLP